MDEKQRMIDFLKANEACEEGFEFAIQECNSLTDCWNKAKPDWLVWLATRKNVLTDRELHEFMLASAESVKHLMKDQRSLDALSVKRRWLDGEATDEELKEAKRKAAAAAAAAAGHYYVARAAAAAAKSTNNCYYAIAAARNADEDGREEGYKKQAAWLRNNTKPNL